MRRATCPQCAHEAVHRLAVLEGIDCRDRLDTKLLRHRRVLVDIHLHELHGAPRRLHRVFEHGRQLLAGAAPGCPEIDDDRHLARCLDHVAGKGLCRRVHNEAGRGFRAGRISDDRFHESRLGFLSGLPGLCAAGSRSIRWSGIFEKQWFSGPSPRRASAAIRLPPQQGRGSAVRARFPSGIA